LGNNFWTVAERLSWLVAIVGLPFGVYLVFALRREQSRVAQELARRPELIVGFYPFSDGKEALSLRQNLVTTWQPGNTWSDPVEFTTVCHNAGPTLRAQRALQLQVSSGIRLPDSDSREARSHGQEP
jgi:hypothetical protein